MLPDKTLFYLFIAVFFFAGIFVRAWVGYLLALIGAVLCFAVFKGIVSQETIYYIAGAYLAIILLLRFFIHLFPQHETRLNMGVARIFDWVFSFFTGRSLTDRLRALKEQGEKKGKM